MVFEIGKIYKFMVQKGYEQNSIYTITVEGEDELFVNGTDKKGQQRGIKKTTILDWVKVSD